MPQLSTGANGSVRHGCRVSGMRSIDELDKRLESEDREIISIHRQCRLQPAIYPHVRIGVASTGLASRIEGLNLTVN
jgi:hypothetical protein